MRYRALDVNGDYRFGASDAEFLANSPDAVAQAVRTRFELWSGEWYLDLTEGTPYVKQILGEGTRDLYDQAIQERILDTEGVTGITDYASSLDETTRALSVSATITTIYGTTTVTL